MTEEERLGCEISRAALEGGLTVGAAESLTGGMVSSLLAKAPDAGRWFRGGVVAYSPEVKQAVLGVAPGPVVTATCARQMARGAAKALGAAAGPRRPSRRPAGCVLRWRPAAFPAAPR